MIYYQVFCQHLFNLSLCSDFLQVMTYQDGAVESAGYPPTDPACPCNNPRNWLGGAYSDNVADAELPPTPCNRHRARQPNQPNTRTH